MWPFRKRPAPQPEPAPYWPTPTGGIGSVRWLSWSSPTVHPPHPVATYTRPDDIEPWMLADTERQEAPVTTNGTPYPPERTAEPGHYPDPPDVDPADSGVHAAPDTRPLRTPCPYCFGTGHVMTTSDLLRQSLGLLGDDPDEHQGLMAEFYMRLLRAAPDLAPLFPRDLTIPVSSGKGKEQRDKLLGALLALGQLYDPDHPDSEDMQILRTHLETFGRTHAAFLRPDGRVRGATVLEYAAVFSILMATLHDAIGGAWTAAYDEVWDEAYDFAARGMIAAAWSAGPSHPRTVRSADFGRAASEAMHAEREALRRG